MVLEELGKQSRPGKVKNNLHEIASSLLAMTVFSRTGFFSFIFSTRKLNPAPDAPATSS